MENAATLVLTTLIDIQRQIYSSLSGYLTAFATNRDWGALLGLLPAGVVFGAVHALTPGHGKSVLASYLLGSRLQAMRATAVAGVLSLTHVGSAVILALLAAPLITRTGRRRRSRACAGIVQPWNLGRDRALATIPRATRSPACLR